MTEVVDGTTSDERIVEAAASGVLDLTEDAAAIEELASELTEIVECVGAVEESTQASVPMVKIATTMISKLNLADYVNAVPVIRGLKVINETTQRYRSLTLTLSAEPPIFKPKTWNIDELSPKSFLQIPGLDVELDSSLLTQLVESEYAKLSFELTIPGLNDTDQRVEVAKCELTLEMLPRNHWGGLSHIPEMTATFVQPNDPAIDTLLKKACDLLAKAGKNSSLDGYGSGSEHAWELTSAIWNAVLSMELDYALPPSSFELNGQKVRSPSHIATSGLATCMDTTMLFCAALEQSGLNPIAIFTKGHAFAGVWLKEAEFTTSTITDVTSLRKRIKLNELAVFETTLVTNRQKFSLHFAIERGNQQLAESFDDKFNMALDIRRSRMQRIKPLSTGDNGAPTAPPYQSDESEVEEQELIGLMIEAPIALPAAAPIEVDIASLDPADRMARWQRKLLDLSLKNGLLNFKLGKKSLKLEAPDPGALEDVLSTGRPMKMLPRPDMMDGSDPRDKEIYESRERASVRSQHAFDALKRDEVYIGLTQFELDTRLLELYRSARTNLEEGGSNTLFLAVGFLSWSPSNREDTKYRAPLILIPVQLERKNIRTGFSMVLHTDEPRFNPTLSEMLRQDFGLHLGVVDGELPLDDAGLDIAEIWRKVSHAIRDIKGWEVVEDVVLSLFSFAKHLMWQDLVDRRDNLRENRVVRHLLDTPRDAYAGNSEYGTFPEKNKLDSDFSPRHVFCPLPYDSSQLSAVMAVSQGRDMVLIGPPGTGKSQTIVNIIAQSLANNKRVLFVSEKIAALNVVHRRLDDVGLGEFCVEIHSNKANKAEVLSKLNRAWKAGEEADADSWAREAERLDRVRRGLNLYVEQLHDDSYPNGLSIYKAIGSTVAGEDLPRVDLSWPSHLLHNKDAIQTMLELSDRLEVNAKTVGFKGLANHPLAAICQVDWSPTWQHEVIHAAREMLPAIAALEASAAKLIQSFDLPDITLDAKGRTGLSLLAQALPTAAGQDWGVTLHPDARQVFTRLKRGCELIQQHQLFTAALSAPWTAATLNAAQRSVELLKRKTKLIESLPALWPKGGTDAVIYGLERISQIQSAKHAMSVPYTKAVEQLDVDVLIAEWHKAEAAFWPKSALGKRSITQQLAQATANGETPSTLEDLQRLSSIRVLRQKINSLKIPVETVTCWKGIATDPSGAALQAVHFQKAMEDFHSEGKWVDKGFDLIAAGEAGVELKQALQALRDLKNNNDSLAGLAQQLSETTDGLWNGLSTCADAMASAVAFQQERRTLIDNGVLDAPHESVANGECGPSLQQQHKRLTQRAEVEVSLKEYADLRELAGCLWVGLSTKIEAVQAAVEFYTLLGQAFAHLATTPEAMRSIKEPLGQLLGDANVMLEPDGLLSQNCTQYLSALEDFKTAKEKLAAVAFFSLEGSDTIEALDLAGQRQACEAIMAQENQMRVWSAWRKIREEAILGGLQKLVDAIEDSRLEPGTVRKVFETNYARWWLNTTVDHNPVIRAFVSAEHEKRIRDFRDLDKLLTDLSTRQLRANLCMGLPAQEEVSQSSEWGILRHEISKKTRHKPLRELMSSIPGAITKLAPCMLMSPLSIAQYLPANAEKFDIVIFDEASQITVWDALGAIARGRQVIMVGDPKQMPPTSFFGRAESSEDDEAEEPDQESILDECLMANLPTINLLWHYRSRHESLIAFSNSRYYNGELVTFPSPVTNDKAVSFNYVKGVYDRGGSRTNRTEAQALVTNLVARLRVEARKEDKLSFGVVTFNNEQRQLIEDLLEAEIRKDPRLDCFLADNQHESIFVKNLESVQGDERDIIYFSTTFGKDSAGVMTMNFGPMTKSGGERRLNVAITRARHQMLVFSSFKPEDIDLSRTDSKGVRDMKHFLEFAERGAMAIAEANVGSLGGFDSPFEKLVANALSKKGWHVVTQVGVSSFRIDLGIVDPDAPGRFLAGVECDGATYHRSATARDRDMLREQVLRGLGWEILRIWSTDWWINPHGIADKVHANLEAILAESRAKRAKQAVIDEENSTVLDIDDNAPLEAEAAPTLAPVDYRKADPRDVLAADPDAFYSQQYDETLASMIAHVVHKEGPVLDSILAQRIARAHDFARTGSRIVTRVADIAGRYHRNTQEEKGTFYWPDHYETDSKVRFRRPGTAEGMRSVDEICLPELESLARHLIGSDTPSDEVLQAMVKEVGLQKVSAPAKARLELSIARCS